jgi:hypothetical protein
MLSPSLRVAKDRLGHDIAPGDTVTAEGRRICRELSGIPLNIWLNKYAGPAGGQKGMRIGLRDGRILNLDRAPEGEVVTLTASGSSAGPGRARSMRTVSMSRSSARRICLSGRRTAWPG